LVASTAFLEIRLERLRLADESDGWLDRGQYLKSVKGVGLDQLLEVLILEEKEKKNKEGTRRDQRVNQKPRCRSLGGT